MNEDNCYYLILCNEECIVDGGDVLNSGAKMTSYFSFYYEEGKFLDVANMRTLNQGGFTKVD
ncbi:MAG TPA: hypothetical protein VK071_07790 [Tissierellales bacterium]|nr:hypothetical protein [Tissierellales bacterium]